MLVFPYIIGMGYWTRDKTNWDNDRGQRRKVFDILKDYRNNSKSKKGYPESELEPNFRIQQKGKYALVISVIGAIMKIGVFIFLFYAAVMLITYGKHWVE